MMQGMRLVKLMLVILVLLGSLLLQMMLGL